MSEKSRATHSSTADFGLTAKGQTSMLVCRGEVREFGLTGLTRNQVSLTAPGVRIPPSPPSSFSPFAVGPKVVEVRACADDSWSLWQRRRAKILQAADLPLFISVSIEFGATTITCCNR